MPSNGQNAMRAPTKYLVRFLNHDQWMPYDYPISGEWEAYYFACRASFEHGYARLVDHEDNTYAVFAYGHRIWHTLESTQ